jgi:hypothetical protein
MDKKLMSELLALILLLIAFPIISFGATQGNSPLWWTGFAAVVVGGVLPVLTRYMDHSGDEVRDMGVEFDDRTP